MQNTRFMTKTKPTLTDQYSHQAAHLTARTSSGPSMTKGSKHYKQTHTHTKKTTVHQGWKDLTQI